MEDEYDDLYPAEVKPATLQMKDFLGYLPYGLKSRDYFDGHELIRDVTLNNAINYVEGHTNAKLMLRPVSCLLQEILHKGKRFIPIVELAEIEGLLPADTGEYRGKDISLSLLHDPENSRALTPCKFIYNIESHIFEITSTSWHNMKVNKHRELMAKLDEWMIDYNDLIGKGFAVELK